MEIDSGDRDARHDARRRYYRLTPLGRRAAVSEAALLARLTETARAAGLLPDQRQL